MIHVESHKFLKSDLVYRFISFDVMLVGHFCYDVVYLESRFKCELEGINMNRKLCYTMC